MASNENPSPAEPGSHRWFVVANGSRAKAYVQRIGEAGYDVIRAWDSPGMRMTSADRGEDLPEAPEGVKRVGIETEDLERSPKGNTLDPFEDVLVDDLTQALRRRELSGLYLVAPAPLLHRLTARLPTDLKQVLVAEHAGDFTQRPAADVFRHLDSLRRGEDAARA
ncbi:host attachment protein [Paracraurococcus lichenis]|uniref:Host attachment protein n=1 Tax=Paracraurococcus lichenis TaxID=3064888 RepID=A0ABT9DXL3_9PROT|nr:host attachment protein [Paracraurococcus sp. LOR1-02]MDO9708525.1 host attachment protein [Paracraurococcus sp. LOR1-02]